MYAFRWNAWNVEHIAEHGVAPEEAEYVVQIVRSPHRRRVGFRKYQVRGQAAGGEYLQVVYIFDPDRTVYVLHARPLSEAEKRQFRRRSK